LRYNYDDLWQTNTLLANKGMQVLMLASDFMNQDGMIPLYWCPMEMRFILNSPSVFLTTLGAGYAVAGDGTIAANAAYTDPAQLVTDYQIKITYNACVYSLDEDSVSSIESMIMSSGLKFDFERCLVQASTILSTESERTITINASRINSLNRILVTFIPQSALNNHLEDKYLFGACESGLVRTAATYNGLTQYQFAIGDNVYPLQSVEISPYNFLQSYMITKEVITDGVNSIGLTADSHSKQTYEGLTMHSQYGASFGRFWGRLENYFTIGYNFRKSSSLQQGLSLAVSPLSINLRFNNPPENHVAVVMLFHSAELNVSDGAVTVNT
jgi:hypothetical protein